MNDPRNSSDLPLSEAGEIRRREILAKASLELGSLKRKRSQIRFLTLSLCGLLAGGLSFAILSSDGPNAKNSAKRSQLATTHLAHPGITPKSAFQPLVEHNRSGLVEQCVVQKVELRTAKLEFEAIDNDELDQLLEESGEDFVVGRIDGELRVLFVARPH